MSDAQLRHVVAGLCKGIGTLERRVHERNKVSHDFPGRLRVGQPHRTGRKRSGSICHRGL